MNNTSIDLNDYAKLIEDGAKIQNSTTEFKNEIDKIYSTIDDLRRSWTGSSAQRYIDHIEEFKEEFETLVKLMKGHGELVENLGKGYRELEENL